MSEDTLLSLLTTLEQADAGLSEFNPNEHMEFLLKSELKIDSYHYILKKYESRITEVQAEIDELTSIKKSLQTRREGLKSMLIWVLKAKGLDQVPGVKHVVKLMQRKKISILAQADSTLFMKHPDIVKREYSWDKKAFDMAYLKDPQTFGQYASEDKTEYVQFYLKRGIDE